MPPVVLGLGGGIALGKWLVTSLGLSAEAMGTYKRIIESRPVSKHGAQLGSQAVLDTAKALKKRHEIYLTR